MFSGAEAGGAAAAGGDPAAAGTKLIDLTDKLDKSGCYARNEDTRFPWTNLMIGDTRLGCKSDADEQLILHFAFQESVKVNIKSVCDVELLLLFNRVISKKKGKYITRQEK
jgi:hypothetical protein